MTKSDEDFIRQLAENERREFWKAAASDVVMFVLSIAAFVALYIILP